MSPKTRKEKEIEVAEEIEERGERNDIVSLKRDVLERDLADEHYSQEDISEILDDLTDDSPFQSRNVRMEILFPDSQEDGLLSEFSENPYYSMVGRLAVGAYFFLIFVSSTEVVNQQLSLDNGQIISVTILSLISSYILGTITENIAKFIEDRKPIVKKYRVILYPWIVLTSICFLLVWAGATASDTNIPPTAFGVIPATCLAATATLVKMTKDPDFSKPGANEEKDGDGENAAQKVSESSIKS